MIEWYNNRFANFSGRATRTEYGYYILFNIIVVLVICLMNRMADNKLDLFFNLCVFQSVMFVPMQALTIRRLRDLGMKWQFFLWNFMPFFNFLLVIYLLLTPGQRGDNHFVPNHKAWPRLV
jgi:uncharacterized membrane protein YhaH (DUF805 family)